MHEDKIKYEIEYTLNTTPKVLYPRLATASGLSEWFADDVRLNKNIYTFIWDGSEQSAEMIGKKNNEYVQFHWTDDEDEDTFFEFRLHQDELTSDLALIITDFADDEEEKEDNTELWDTQIQELKRILGL
ncbi:MAG: START-like domain-containing protein [Bacteroidales bacterium]